MADDVVATATAEVVEMHSRPGGDGGADVGRERRGPGRVRVARLRGTGDGTVNGGRVHLRRVMIVSIEGILHKGAYVLYTANVMCHHHTGVALPEATSASWWCSAEVGTLGGGGYRDDDDARREGGRWK